MFALRWIVLLLHLSAFAISDDPFHFFCVLDHSVFCFNMDLSAFSASDDPRHLSFVLDHSASTSP